MVSAGNSGGQQAAALLRARVMQSWQKLHGMLKAVNDRVLQCSLCLAPAMHVKHALCKQAVPHTCRVHQRSRVTCQQPRCCRRFLRP